MGVGATSGAMAATSEIAAASAILKGGLVVWRAIDSGSWVLVLSAGLEKIVVATENDVNVRRWCGDGVGKARFRLKCNFNSGAGLTLSLRFCPSVIKQDELYVCLNS